MVLITKSKPRFVDSLRTDKRIISIVTRPKSTLRSKTIDAFNTFNIADLLGNGTYSVELWNSLYQLIFPGGNRELVVTIQPYADVMAVADLILSHLEEIMESG